MVLQIKLFICKWGQVDVTEGGEHHTLPNKKKYLVQPVTVTYMYSKPGHSCNYQISQSGGSSTMQSSMQIQVMHLNKTTNCSIHQLSSFDEPVNSVVSDA